MKKTLTFIAAIGLLLVVVSCGGYDDVSSVFEEGKSNADASDVFPETEETTPLGLPQNQEADECEEYEGREKNGEEHEKYELSREPALPPFPDAVPLNAIAISASHEHNLAITADGALWSWGAASGYFDVAHFRSSPLGDGTTEPRRTPVKIMENVVHAVAGPHQSLAITSDGGLYMWSGLRWWETCEDAIEARLSPVRVLDDVVYATMPLGVPCSHAGYIGARVLAIRTDGTLWSWGNAGWQGAWPAVIGDGTEESRSHPVQIMENVHDVIPTSSGGFAITHDNVLWQWRRVSRMWNEYDESIEIPALLVPTPIMENIATMSDGLVITTDGELFSLPPIGEPVRLMSNVIYAIFHRAGISYSGSIFAITADNILYAWGQNSLANQWMPRPPLGDGTTIDRETPVRIMENAASITIIGNTAYVIQTDGTLWGWGNIGAVFGGQILIGDGSEFIGIEGYAWEDMFEYAYEYSLGRVRWRLPDCGGSGIRLAPVKIMENVVQVAATYIMIDHGWVRSFRAFAVTENGELWAWGENDDFNHGFSLLGNGTSERRAYPVRIIEGNLLKGEHI